MRIAVVSEPVSRRAPRLPEGLERAVPEGPERGARERGDETQGLRVGPEHRVTLRFGGREPGTQVMPSLNRIVPPYSRRRAHSEVRDAWNDDDHSCEDRCRALRKTRAVYPIGVLAGDEGESGESAHHEHGQDRVPVADVRDVDDPAPGGQRTEPEQGHRRPVEKSHGAKSQSRRSRNQASATR